MKEFFEKERTSKKEIPIENEKISEDHWFKIGEELYKKLGEVPDPLQIRAQAIIEAFRIPSFPYSSIEKGERGKKEKERDKIIAEYLTNRPGVWIDREKGIISLDFRDMYPEGLPRKLKKALSPDTLEIMETEYEHLKEINPETENSIEADCPIHYFRLPGGVDLFMKGYIHNKIWQERHSKFLQKMNKKAKVICIEGRHSIPFGESLELLWSHPDFQFGHYDKLMKEAVKEGFRGLFTEVDARDVSKIRMDVVRKKRKLIFPDLPSTFFLEFFKFLETQHPQLKEEIETPEKLKEYLIDLSTTYVGIFKRRKKRIFYKGKQYTRFPYITKEGKTSFKPTLLELGQHLFSDALAAIKLHLIARLMAEGKIEKGPIIDYQGAGHLSSKTFFLKHPEYAMEVVLRNIHELMAGRVKKGEISEICDIFKRPDWEEAVKEIAKLVFKKPSPDREKLLDIKIDFLKTFNLDPKQIIPSDEKIEKIREKINKLITKEK